MPCPFAGCSCSYTVISSFTSHISRNHQSVITQNEHAIQEQDDRILSAIDDGILHSVNVTDVGTSRNIDTTEGNTSSVVEPSAPFSLDNTDRSSFLNSLALFLLKLESQCFVPKNTIQYIVYEIKCFNEIQHDCVTEMSSNVLTKSNVASDIISKAVEVISTSFMIEQYDEMRSIHTRSAFYSNNFNCIPPIQFSLGFHPEQDCIFHYVSLVKSVQLVANQAGNSFRFGCHHSDNVICDIFDGNVYKTIRISLGFHPEQDCIFHYVSLVKSVQLVANQAGNSFIFGCHHSDNVICDIFDGNVYKTKCNSEHMQLLLYQDSFEICNPLGSSKKKHKLLAVYAMIGNLPPQYRSSLDNIILVMLVKESHIKVFGQKIVFQQLLYDLIKLETEGIELQGRRVKCQLFSFWGDNLGSHMIGGFSESFSCEFFCRYCLMTKDKFKTEPYESGVLRNVSHYETVVKRLQLQNANMMHGIKINSVFNQL